MEQEGVRLGLVCQAVLPVLLGERPPRKQDVPSMCSAVWQTRAARKGSFGYFSGSCRGRGGFLGTVRA